MTFRYAHIFFGGFTQRSWTPGDDNGVQELYLQLYRTWAGPQTLVEYFDWYADPGRIAAFLAGLNQESLAQTGQPLLVQIVGYSFGGQTAAHVAAALRGTAAEIDTLILCDAVCRRGSLGWLAAANPWATIHVPATVNSLRVFHQRHPRWQLRPPFFWPAGHRVTRHPRVCLEGQHDLTTDRTTHLTIDNHGAFHDYAIDAARALHERPRAIPMRAPADRDLAGGDYLKDAA